MDILEAITKRKSIRTYRKQTLPEGTVERLLEAAILAPSAGNVQPWKFVVVKTPENKAALAKAAYGQKYLEQAAAVIAVCANEQRAEESYGTRGKTLYCLQDTAAAIQNILLTACSLGLGTCWIGAFKEEETRKVINAPREVKPVALITVGYPNESPPGRPRLPLREVMVEESF